ncbi:hypothetical protein JCM10914A_56240 [Paenibacillus sp. JCM 10914]|uniref:DUF7667 family protein n=1 Tax=Paenibacillus sp. JCM 10914 TaxID=1236974 RepID=UPI0003CC53AA|nr:hypothetical protein [Paenibacillus sp. JCM 10914]GAE09581.1 hypothetical protein JCM10914_5946 [Paenibacillus sp. JCM 10914]
MKDLAIHTSHRRLAEITFLNLDRNGKLIIDEVTLRVLEPYLLQNLEIVRTLDELSNLSMVAYTAGDTEWLHAICGSIEYVKEESSIQKGEWK